MKAMEEAGGEEEGADEKLNDGKEKPSGKEFKEDGESVILKHEP